MANDLNTKLEEALKSVVDGLTISGVDAANTGLDDDELDAPYVICSAPSSDPDIVPGIGYFRFNCVVTVASLADAARALQPSVTRLSTATFTTHYRRLSAAFTSLLAASTSWGSVRRWASVN